MRILHLEYDHHPVASTRELERYFKVEAWVCASQQQLYEKLEASKYDAVFMRLGLNFDRKAMQLQPTLKYIISPTTGLNHIDVEAAALQNITIISLKGEQVFLANIKSTAEHTWALLLTLIRRLGEASESVLRGEWKRELFLSDELDGKKLGIIGYGRLGKIVGRYGLAFGMEVYVNDRDEDRYAEKDPGIKAVHLDELLQACDYIVLLISYAKENENFLETTKFSLFKAGSYFVNTSRGEMVSEEALLSALQSGRLKGAALDVLRNDSVWEGRPEGSKELLEYARHHKNLIITPHVGGYGVESTSKTKMFVVQKFLNLEKPWK